MRLLLLPFSFIYSSIIALRHWLYNVGVFKSYANFGVSVVCVGNLNLGGTGKTPFTEFLIQHLSEQYQLAILSRGYKRHTKGYVLANVQSTVNELGDEPFQMYQKFANKIHLAVCEDRKTGIETLIKTLPNLQLIILDDAFQHRKVAANFNILLTDYNVPFYKDYCLPTGKLRDIVNAQKRAHAVVLTKSPQAIPPQKITEAEQATSKIHGQQLFFSAIEYQLPENPFTKQQFTNGDLLLVTGIANARPLKTHLEQNFGKVSHLQYADHYAYTADSIAKIGTFAAHKKAIVVTEKDWVKIQPQLTTETQKWPWFVIKISFSMGAEQQAFLSLLKQSIQKH